MTRYWAAEGVSAGPDAWRFTPERGRGLAPGHTYLFAFKGRRGTGEFRVYSCSVSSGSCTQFR